MGARPRTPPIGTNAPSSDVQRDKPLVRWVPIEADRATAPGRATTDETPLNERAGVGRARTHDAFDTE